MARALDVWMNGELVGTWDASRQGVPTFQYSARWQASPAGRALSLSLPFTAGNAAHRGAVVAHYFDNLLPDSLHIRNRVAARFKTPSMEAMDLLTAIGRDCIGAVQLLPSGEESRGWDRIAAKPLSDADVEHLLRATTSDVPLGQRAEEDLDDFRISLAGAQEKTALLRMGGKWYRPLGATPTTHILKLPLGLVGNMRMDMTESVENEWLCAQIVGELGLPVAHTEMAVFGRQKVLVVERFDRRWQGAGTAAWIARLPQEDMCQATGTAPTRKYEADGGPGMAQCLDILRDSRDEGGRATDSEVFALAQLAFWLLAATDGHGKNFSIQHLRGGKYQLAPLYDVLSAWPIMGNGPNQIAQRRAKLAMALRGKNTHYRLADIQARHWQALAARCPQPEQAWLQMLALVQSVDVALERVQAQLPTNFPDRLWTKVATGMRRQARLFMTEAESLQV